MVRKKNRSRKSRNVAADQHKTCEQVQRILFQEQLNRMDEMILEGLRFKEEVKFQRDKLTRMKIDRYLEDKALSAVRTPFEIENHDEAVEVTMQQLNEMSVMAIAEGSSETEAAISLMMAFVSSVETTEFLNAGEFASTFLNYEIKDYVNDVISVFTYFLPFGANLDHIRWYINENCETSFKTDEMARILEEGDYCKQGLTFVPSLVSNWFLA